MQPLPDPVVAATSQNPRETYDRLRAEGAFVWFAPRQTWLATTDAAVRAVLAHPDARVRPSGEPVPPTLAGTVAGEIFGKLVRMRDGARQLSAKTAVQRALETIDLDRVWTESARQAEAIDVTALPESLFSLPVRVMGWLLGLPEARLDRLPSLVRDFARCIGPGASDATIAPGVAAATELSSWFDDLLPNTKPPELLGCLREAFASAGITETGIVRANAVGLLFQAYDATAGLLASTLLRLSRSAPVTGPPSNAEIDAAVSAVLMNDAPVQNTRRFAAAEMVIHGRRVPAGDPILVLLASAAHDPDASDSGDRAFGFGPHACPGQQLADAIVTSAVPVLLRRGVPGSAPDPVRFLASPNARVPLLDGRCGGCPVSGKGDGR